MHEILVHIISCLKIISCKCWPRLRFKWSIRLVQFWRTLSNVSAGISHINVLMLPSNALIEAGLSWIAIELLGGQLTDPEREIKCSPNSPLNKSIVTRAVWHVAPSCWNHMSCKSSSCILGKKSWISFHGSAHHSQLRYDSQHLWRRTSNDTSSP